MPVDDTRNTPGYVCGRIIAAYELIAHRAGVELPLQDLRLSATSPVYTVPRLRTGPVRKALASMRPKNPEAVARIEDYLSGLVARLDDFPQRLDMRQQAEYLLGQMHQKAAGLPW